MAAMPAHATAATASALVMTAAQADACATPVGSSLASESVQALKARAILDGAPSALERIRMAQARLAAASAESSSGGGTDACRVGASLPQPIPQQLAVPASPAVEAPSQVSSGTFLDSLRIPIARTRFDADWARVSAVRLSARTVERSMGSPDQDRLALIEQVNRWANRIIVYRPDSPNYHGGDYWADARQTMRTRAGDCEDFAILKYQALLAFGVPPGDIYFTMARDLVRHADHALVVVRYQGRYLLLDDSTDVLLDGSQPNDYQPFLSFGGGKWIHGLAADSQPAVYLSRNELSNPRVMGVVR